MEQLTTHLSVFALDINTGAPLSRLPIYAEVGMRGVLENDPNIPLDGRFVDWIEGVLRDTDEACFADEACRRRMREALVQGISRLLTQEARDRLAGDPARTQPFLSRVIRRAQQANGGAPLAGVEAERLRRLLLDAIRAEAREQGLELVPDAEPMPIQWTHPMGILATDHVGYLSFDLRRLPLTVRHGIAESIKRRQKDSQATLDSTIWLYPLVHGLNQFDALAQARFAHDAVVVRLALQQPNLPAAMRNAGFLALQNPDLTDWRLSPASFAANPGALVGADGCESLLPANMALQEFHFYQVVRLMDVVPPNVPPPLQQQVKLGVAHDYRMAWYPLGHSLGQIQYSLALAPGESVNLAVIDWTRQDETVRTEDTKLNERLVHNQRRDRTITETVKAALSEYQEGSSFMAGIAGSAGGSASMGVAGGAVGMAGALGGSSSDSSGSRDLAANTVQQLSENISQASAAMRELQSTVVVRSSQSERETIETRTIVNYNHSHALTILYYEVLRHFRVVTDLSSRRPVALVKMKADWFEGAEAEKMVLHHRRTLEAALLDSDLAGAFDALARKVRRDKQPKLPPPVYPPIELRYFSFHMTTGGIVIKDVEDEDVNIEATLFGPEAIKLVNQAGGPSDILDHPGAFSQENAVQSFVAMPKGRPPVAWNTIDGIGLAIGLHDTHVSFSRITIIARDTNGVDHTILDQDYGRGHLIITKGTQITLPLNRPPAPPPAPARPAEEIEDVNKSHELVEHLRYYKAHYSRAILLRQNAAERARMLDEIKLPDGTSLLDHVENRPLEVLGEYMAYPATNPNWRTQIMAALQQRRALEVPLDERLVTLPTRGVFAEARLGHCNASEEIDNTRFWDWQQSPIPHLAPEIAPVQPVTPQPQQQNVQPTPFPQSLVNIVNPPAAPDPTGLAGALNVLATPNIFRDMSGRAEVADLLKRLSDNTISIAEASNIARGIQGKYGNSGGGAGASLGGGSGGGGTPIGGARARPNEPSVANRDLHDLQRVLGQAENRGLLKPGAGQAIYEAAAREAYGAKPMLAFSYGGVGNLTDPFPSPYPDPLRPDTKLQTALDDAIAHAHQTFPTLPNPLNVAFAIVAIEGNGPEHPVAHHNGGQMHFSGSLLKYAAMYAAFELRAAVNQFAKRVVVQTPQELFTLLRQQFDSPISSSVRALAQDSRMRPEMLAPKYEKVFDAKPKQGVFELDFTATFLSAMKEMLNISNNFSARHCIHMLSYGWINGALQHGGFFDPATQRGIWLAGDYQLEKDWPYLRVNSVNDGPVGMVMTCLEAARLYTLLHDKKLVGAPESTAMLKLLADVVAHPIHEVFIDRAPGLSFRVTHNKLGVAELKKENGKFSVASEASIVKHTASGREFVVVWQNRKFTGDTSLRPISQIVNETIQKYLAP